MKIKFFTKKAEEDTRDLTIIITSCPACAGESGGKICMHCGENLYPKRITFPRLLKTIPDVFFDLEYGLLYTIRTFFKRPGRELREYFAGNRQKHYKPLKYLLFICGFVIFLNISFNIKGTQEGLYASSYKQQDELLSPANKTGPKLDEFAKQWESAIILLAYPFAALASWLLFKKKKLTFGEHLVAVAYFIGQVTLFPIFFFPAYYFWNGTNVIDVLYTIYFLFILAYLSYAYYDWMYAKKTISGFFICTGASVLLLLVFAFIQYIATPYLYTIKVSLFGEG
jgi:hypothetical protein